MISNVAMEKRSIGIEKTSIKIEKAKFQEILEFLNNLKTGTNLQDDEAIKMALEDIKEKYRPLYQFALELVIKTRLKNNKAIEIAELELGKEIVNKTNITFKFITKKVEQFRSFIRKINRDLNAFNEYLEQKETEEILELIAKAEKEESNIFDEIQSINMLLESNNIDNSERSFCKERLEYLKRQILDRY